MKPLVALSVVLALGCSRTAATPPPATAPMAHHGHGHMMGPHGHGHTLDPAHASPDEAVMAVSAVHGGSGPFAMAGWRMGVRALHELSTERGSFDLEVVHESPNEVQWSCIADGAAAATGTSMGRLNLRRETTTDGSTRTTIRNRRTGQTVVFGVSPGFTQRYENTPREQLPAAGRTVLELRDDDVFRVTPTPGGR